MKGIHTIIPCIHQIRIASDSSEILQFSYPTKNKRSQKNLGIPHLWITQLPELRKSDE